MRGFVFLLQRKTLGKIILDTKQNFNVETRILSNVSVQ